ncbi:MAG: Spy/CpxP family protein refolding chaperone [Ideonella sp.]|nr:Spy/CpxP family protein refolding chaperone [Ideonella sp.]MCC7458440.1 Spy/CpxP family protein refolding chaperone [Nitrospira sp.]
MKRWLRRTLIGVFGASVLFGGMAACSHRVHHGDWSSMSEEDGARMKARMIERVAGRLDLDEAQKAKLGALADQLRASRQALRGSTDPRSELQSLVAGNTFDRAKAKALIDAKTSTIQSRSPELISALGDFYDSLKPEQQQKVREFMARGRHGWRG